MFVRSNWNNFVSGSRYPRDERKLRAREFSFNLFPINKINRIRGERESSIRENF